MNIKIINEDVQKRRDNGINSPCTGVTPNASPEVLSPLVEEHSQTGVSTRNAPAKTIRHKPPTPETIPHWYAIRCTYGRERKAYEFFSKNGIKAFYPTITNTKSIDGKTEKIVESRLPNILFAYDSFDQLKEYVYENGDDTKYLRFYYNIHHDKTKEPLIIPQRQMASLMRICDAEAEDKHLEPFMVEKFKQGQLVRVKDGPFAGVEGIVKRYKGQQRVGFVVEGLFTITTAYIAKDKLELIEERSNIQE